MNHRIFTRREKRLRLCFVILTRVCAKFFSPLNFRADGAHKERKKNHNDPIDESAGEHFDGTAVQVGDSPS